MDEFNRLLGVLGDVGLAIGETFVNSKVAEGAIPPGRDDITVTLVEESVGFEGKLFTITVGQVVDGYNVAVDMDLSFPNSSPGGTDVDGVSELRLTGMSMDVREFSIGSDAMSLDLTPATGVVTGSIIATIEGDAYNIKWGAMTANLGIAVRDIANGIDIDALLTGSVGDGTSFLEVDLPEDGSALVDLPGADLYLDVTTLGLTEGEGAASSSVEAAPPVTEEASSSSSSAPEVEAATLDGEALFLDNCGACHNANGIGSGPSNIGGESAAEISNAIGSVPQMSGANLQALTAEEIQAIADLL